MISMNIWIYANKPVPLYFRVATTTSEIQQWHAKNGKEISKTLKSKLSHNNLSVWSPVQIETGFVMFGYRRCCCGILCRALMIPTNEWEQIKQHKGQHFRAHYISVIWMHHGKFKHQGGSKENMSKMLRNRPMYSTGQRAPASSIMTLSSNILGLWWLENNLPIW